MLLKINYSFGDSKKFSRKLSSLNTNSDPQARIKIRLSDSSLADSRPITAVKFYFYLYISFKRMVRYTEPLCREYSH